MLASVVMATLQIRSIFSLKYRGANSNALNRGREDFEILLMNLKPPGYERLLETRELF
jgi:hypothetical protein